MSQNRNDTGRTVVVASLLIEAVKPVRDVSFDELVAGIVAGKYKTSIAMTYDAKGQMAFDKVLVLEEV